MLGDIRQAKKVYIVCGYTDMRKGLNSLVPFVLLYKRLDNGRYQWPRNAQEVRQLTWEQFTWLMQGLSIEQPKAIKPGKPKALV
mgnify:CR=1 FL=1